MLMKISRRRNEDAAVAVVVAIMSLVIFAVAAFAVDLSNAFVRKRGVQAQADFAALAGSAQLGAEKSGTVPTAVVGAVRDYLNNNRPPDDKGVTAVTSAQLTDSNDSNGEVRFAGGGLQVVSPQAQVNYGFARLLGYKKVDVSARATVGVFTPGVGTMPMYAVSGCDWGAQSITDPASGAAATTPPLAFNTDANVISTKSITPVELPLNAASATIQLTAHNFTNTTKIGFFRGDNTSPSLVVETSTFTPAPPAGGYSKNGQDTITVPVPSTVTATEVVWYIRAYQAGSVNKWSLAAEAPRLRIGQAVLECDSASSDGNFGTLKLPRTDEVPANWLARNVADGFQKPINLAVHATPAANWLCSDGVNGAVVSTTSAPITLRPNTNCVDTDTGLPANVATAGMISGVGATPGRIRAASSSTSQGSGCAPDGTTAPRSVLMPPNTYTINNDVLTCFLTDGSISLGDITSSTYNGGAKLSPDIYNSPRFFWQPVLGVEPTSGGSNRYSIVDFRPAFLTDELVAPATVRGTNTASANNGVVIQNGQIKQLKVVFFNAKALPADDNGVVVTPFIGVGPKILRLID